MMLAGSTQQVQAVPVLLVINQNQAIPVGANGLIDVNGIDLQGLKPMQETYTNVYNENLDNEDRTVQGNRQTRQDVTITVEEEEQKQNILQRLANFLNRGNKKDEVPVEGEYPYGADYYQPQKQRVYHIEENVQTQTDVQRHFDNSKTLNTDAKNVRYGDVGTNAVIFLI